MSSPLRLGPLKHPVTLTLDGEPFQAEGGEPLAAALIAAEKLTIARSPKFHRPRAPTCLRGACDGCLARVDETANVMTFLVAGGDGNGDRFAEPSGATRRRPPPHDRLVLSRRDEPSRAVRGYPRNSDD